MIAFTAVRLDPAIPPRVYNVPYRHPMPSPATSQRGQVNSGRRKVGRGIEALNRKTLQPSGFQARLGRKAQANEAADYPERRFFNGHDDTLRQ